MTGDQIQELLHATPFVPFKIVVAEQKVIEIPHPDFASLTRSKRIMAVNNERGTAFQLIDVMLIGRIEIAESKQA